MLITIRHDHQDINVDLSQPWDISLTVQSGEGNPNCYWTEDAAITTIRSEGFVGSVAEGGSVNHRRLSIAPHGNGTHTECYGHISADTNATIDQCLKTFHFMATLISVYPEMIGEDNIITKTILANALTHPISEALVIRTLPNDEDKKTKNHSGTNPPYMTADAMALLVEMGVHHLLIDLPSVDKEIDGGQLSAHKAFWQYPKLVPDRKTCTITELVFVPAAVTDGQYFLNLQVMSIRMDASPSKPILYKIVHP